MKFVFIFLNSDTVKKLYHNIFPLLVLAAGVLAYRNILFSTGPACQVIDMKDLVFPKYYFIREAFIRGEFPFWDPYTMLGQPGIFNMQAGATYPLLLAFLAMGFLGHLLPRQIELFMVFHILLSGIAMYWGTRRLGLSRIGACLAGIVFQMAAINKYMLLSLTYTFGMPWFVLAICFGIALFRSGESIMSQKNILPLLIVVISLSLLISITYPNFVIYTFLTLGMIVIFYFLDKVKRADWFGALNILKKSFCVFVLPLLATAFIILPCYAVLRDSIRYDSSVKILIFGIFHLPYTWTLLFPGFINYYMEQPIGYTGVITLILAVYFCIKKGKDDVNDGFLFVILSVFWFFYAIEGSLLGKVLSHLPVLNLMRFPHNGLIIYAFSISILAGKGLERLLNLHENKVGLNKNWLFPAFIITMLMYSLPSFNQMINKGNPRGGVIALFFGFAFILYLISQRFIASDRVRNVLCTLVPVIVILEISISLPELFRRSNHEPFFPYKPKLEKIASDFPECFLKKDLYRFENIHEYMITEYYFDKFSTYGYYAPGTHPARYYYLWDRLGRAGPGYQKWWVDEGDRIMPLSLESRLYDLAGVRYFYLPEHEWLFVDYKISGRGEWVSARLFNKVLVSSISIYNTPNPEHRRMIRATIVLNDDKQISVDIPNEEGWHRFNFESTELAKIKIIADEVIPFEIGEGTRGVVIGEIELLDGNGQKIDVAVKNFDASSTMLVSNPSMIMDNRLGHVWESRCSVVADNVLASQTLERVNEGCYINKDVLPRAFMVHGYKYVKDRSSFLQDLHNEGFRPDKEVLLEGETIKFDLPKCPYNDNVEIVGYRLNEVQVLVKNDKPGFLVLSDMYAPGWQVFVNGKEDRLLIADGLFRGVFLDRGDHKVTFRYTPPLLKLGTVISSVCLVIIFGCLLTAVARNTPQRHGDTEVTE